MNGPSFICWHLYLVLMYVYVCSSVCCICPLYSRVRKWDVVFWGGRGGANIFSHERADVAVSQEGFMSGHTHTGFMSLCMQQSPTSTQ